MNKNLKPIPILGELIDSDNVPVLYRRARSNPEWLSKELLSIVKAWHGSDVRAAMIALENDLEHG